MSGETEQNISGWTVDTLHVHLQKQIADLRTLLDERYSTQTRNVDSALAAVDKRFDAVNEFRQTLSDQTSSFMPRIEAEARMTAFDIQLRALNQIVTRHQGRTTGMDKSWVMLVGAVGVIATLVALVSRFGG